jgi:autotransporter-associated beta strand protein
MFPGSGDYNTDSNWSGNSVPLGAAFFGTSTVTDLSTPDKSIIRVGEWIFKPGASQYSFNPGIQNIIEFVGEGIIVRGGSVNITGSFGFIIDFENASTAGSSSITVSDTNVLSFDDLSTAGTAKIHTLTGGRTGFTNFSTGGSAQLVTDAGGTVDFSQSAGPNDDFKLTVGLIEGQGEYDLGSDKLTVGLNGRSAEVSGPIDDGGDSGGSGGSLVKVGHDRLTLSHAFNTYSGGTTIKAGILELAALGSAGTGDIAFKGVGKLKVLKIENAALLGHHFTNTIDFFDTHDALDLSGLKFHPGAFATFHHQLLKVHNGSGKTDAVKLIHAHGTLFSVASDGHGGTEVTLDPPPVPATVAGDLDGQHSAADTIGSANHLGDFLFGA